MEFEMEPIETYKGEKIYKYVYKNKTYYHCDMKGVADYSKIDVVKAQIDNRQPIRFNF